MRIVIPGGTGQVGRVLARHFYERGDDVVVLSRHARTDPWPTVVWTATDRDLWTEELEDADVLINLAGRSVDCRYTHANRLEMRQSRIETTEVLGTAVSWCRNPPKLWLNASSATIYRHELDTDMDEITGDLGGDEPGVPETWRFSAELVKDWEQTFFDAAAPRTRRIALRSAMIMGPGSGNVFEVLLRLVRLALGGAAGPGTQYVSWIHELDFVRAIDFLISQEDLAGPINISSPNPLPNWEFMHYLREAWGADFGFDTPPWLLEIGALALQTETELVLKSRRVVPLRLFEAGFTFEFPGWPEAARDLVVRWRRRRRGQR